MVFGPLVGAGGGGGGREEVIREMVGDICILYITRYN